eukprot:1869371-Karenia_brevis.AAC.1
MLLSQQSDLKDFVENEIQQQSLGLDAFREDLMHLRVRFDEIVGASLHKDGPADGHDGQSLTALHERLVNSEAMNSAM